MREKWFERKFVFDVPAARMPVVIERLRGTADRIEAKLADAPRELLIRREGGAWSALENAAHLHDLEELHLGRLDDLEAGRTALRAADLTNRKTWDSNHNARTLEDVLDGFRKERARLIARFEAWPEGRLEVSGLHPRLGHQMRVIDVAFFTAEHDDSHLARIHELIAPRLSAS